MVAWEIGGISFKSDMNPGVIRAVIIPGGLGLICHLAELEVVRHRLRVWIRFAVLSLIKSRLLLMIPHSESYFNLVLFNS